MSKKQVAGYILDKRIGKGSYATVWRGRVESGDEAVAVKVVSRQTVTVTAQLRSEVEVLRRISHPNIVRFRDLKKSAAHFYLVLEFCAGGDLSQFLRERGRMAEEPARRFLTQIAAGLCVLHHENVLHRDLKPQNILLSDSSDTPTLKIADFGFARALQPQDMAATVCGSPLYMAPEILRHEPYDAKADLWSVGAILFELLLLRPPFSGANPMQLLANIEKQDSVSFDDVQVSTEGQEFIRQLLMRSPVQRLASTAFARHPYVRLGPQMEGNSSLLAPVEWYVSPAAGRSLGAGAPDSLAASPVASPIMAPSREPDVDPRCPSPFANVEVDEPRFSSPRDDSAALPAAAGALEESSACGGEPAATAGGTDWPADAAMAAEVPEASSASGGCSLLPTSGVRHCSPGGGVEEEYVVVAQQPISAWARGCGPTPRAAASDFCGNLSRIAHTLEQLSVRLLEESPLEGLALLLRALGLLEKALNVSLLEEDMAEPLRSDFRRMLHSSELAARQVETSARLPGAESMGRRPACPNGVVFDFAVQQAKEAAVAMSKGREVRGWESACRDKLSLALLLLDLLGSEADGEDLTILASYTAPIARLVGEVERLGRRTSVAGTLQQREQPLAAAM